MNLKKMKKIDRKIIEARENRRRNGLAIASDCGWHRVWLRGLIELSRGKRELNRLIMCRNKPHRFKYMKDWTNERVIGYWADLIKDQKYYVKRQIKEMGMARNLSNFHIPGYACVGDVPR